jgi:ABC-2 type transport system permease protein
MFQRIFAIIQKEFSQTLRDRATLAIMLSMPLLQLILFGYAINTNVRHIPTVVADQSLDHASQAYINDMVNSGYFDIVQSASDQVGAVQAIDAGTAKAGIVIPPDFAEHVLRGDAQAQVLVDGSDLFTSQSACCLSSTR